MPWTPDRLPDLTGSTIVVTGANGGLGFETARVLAGAGAHVVIASRKVDQNERARDRIVAEHPGASVEVHELDLSSLTATRQAAAAILAGHPSIDALVCNSGVMGIPHRVTDDGFDRQWQVNVLGHFELTRLLWPALVAAGGGRVVTISSFARHMRGRFDPADPPIRGEYRRWRAYGQTKMADLRFALELDRRCRAAGVPVAAIAAHPGLSFTRGDTTRPAREPTTTLQKIARWWIRRFGMQPDRGAHSQIRAAADLDAVGGRLYGPRFMTTGASTRRRLMPWTRRRGPGAELWAVAERQTGERFEV